MYVFYCQTGLQFSFCEILSFIQAKYYYYVQKVFQIRFTITLQEFSVKLNCTCFVSQRKTRKPQALNRLYNLFQALFKSPVIYEKE